MEPDNVQSILAAPMLRQILLLLIVIEPQMLAPRLRGEGAVGVGDAALRESYAKSTRLRPIASEKSVTVTAASRP
jgi:hypothetical protein